MSGVADAVEREAAWLTTTGDGLPALMTSAGGAWDIVQAYWPGSRLQTQRTGVYVLRGRLLDQLVEGRRIRPQYEMTLHLEWPLKTISTPAAENTQKAMDAAVADLIGRLRGFTGDKTHGGRFLTAAQVPHSHPPEVRWDDPRKTIPEGKHLTATCTYRIDDLEIHG